MKRILILAMAAFLLTACVQYKDGKPVNEPEKKEEPAASKEPETEEPTDDSWNDFKDTERIIGKSDQDFQSITKSKPGKVRNDNTGNWRIIKFAESVDLEKYLLSYKNEYMESGQTHFLVNFSRNTTTVLNDANGLLSVDVHEYVKKEEHDAADLGNGMLLKSYTIYPDGDIEETD